jgi:hypothetical protein
LGDAGARERERAHRDERERAGEHACVVCAYTRSREEGGQSVGFAELFSPLSRREKPDIEKEKPGEITRRFWVPTRSSVHASGRTTPNDIAGVAGRGTR